MLEPLLPQRIWIGSSWPGMGAERSTSGAVEVAGARLPLPARLAVAEGREVTYGIRPEHLGVGDAGLAGTVAVVEPTGSETHVVVRAGDPSGGREVVAMFRDRVGFRPGDALVLAPDADKVHLFDKGSGVRL